MEGKLPVVSLIRMNVLLTVIVSLATFLFLSVSLEFTTAVFDMLMGLLIISLIGFFHIWILKIAYRKYRHSRVKQKWLRYVLTYLSSMAVYIIVWPLFALNLHLNWMVIPRHQLLIFAISSIMINSLMLVVQNHVLLMEGKAAAEVELSRTKIAHAEAANLLLKQQIHPHFLFNALFTLKALYRKGRNEGDEYLVHLANFLRASVSGHTARLSTVAEEITLLTDYVEMQKIRFGSAFSCTIEIPPETYQRCYLPSFSLQPLVENAIKHNELTEALPLSVTIVQEQHWIVVTNNLRKKNIREASTGNGLVNLTERYRLLSGDTVHIQNTDDCFIVKIKLLTNEHSDH